MLFNILFIMIKGKVVPPNPRETHGSLSRIYNIIYILYIQYNLDVTNQKYIFLFVSI